MQSQAPAPVAERTVPGALPGVPRPPRPKARSFLAAAFLLLVLAWAFAGVQADWGELVKNTPQTVDTLSRMLPPDVRPVIDPAVYDVPKELSVQQLLLPASLSSEQEAVKATWWRNSFPQTILGATLQTIQMALAGTALALVVAFPLSFLVARNTSPHPWVYHLTKMVNSFFRSIPDFTFALVLIAAIGLGPFVGTLALAFGSGTVMVKLFAEAIENIDEGVVEALRATGARYIQVIAFAVVPQVMPNIISTLLYRLESNIRAATVLGMIGAGGIGFIMTSDFRMFEYQKGAMTVTVLIVLVMTVDYISASLRKMVT